MSKYTSFSYKLDVNPQNCSKRQGKIWSWSLNDHVIRCCHYSQCIGTQCQGSWLFETFVNGFIWRHRLSNTITMEDVNTPLSSRDRSTRHNTQERNRKTNLYYGPSRPDICGTFYQCMEPILGYTICQIIQQSSECQKKSDPTI